MDPSCTRSRLIAPQINIDTKHHSAKGRSSHDYARSTDKIEVSGMWKRECEIDGSITTIVAWMAGFWESRLCGFMRRDAWSAVRSFRCLGGNSQILLKSEPTRWEKRGHLLRSQWRVLKLQKPVSLTFHLHILLGNRMVLEASGVQRRFFRQKSDPNMQFGCRADKLMHYSGRRYFRQMRSKDLSRKVGQGAKTYGRC